MTSIIASNDAALRCSREPRPLHARGVGDVIAHRLVRQSVTQVSHGPYDPIIAPTRDSLSPSALPTARFRHQLGDDPGFAKLRSVELVGDEFSGIAQKIRVLSRTTISSPERAKRKGAIIAAERPSHAAMGTSVFERRVCWFYRRLFGSRIPEVSRPLHRTHVPEPVLRAPVFPHRTAFRSTSHREARGVTGKISVAAGWDPAPNHCALPTLPRSQPAA